MGMMKEKLIEEEVGIDEVEEGLRWLSMWGKKSFKDYTCLLYTSPSPRDVEESRMPSSA